MGTGGVSGETSPCEHCWQEEQHGWKRRPRPTFSTARQVVQLLQPDLPKLVLHLRLNESQESCRCPQQQQRHVNEKMSPTPQIQYARQKNRCDKDANKEICN